MLLGVWRWLQWSLLCQHREHCDLVPLRITLEIAPWSTQGFPLGVLWRWIQSTLVTIAPISYQFLPRYSTNLRPAHAPRPQPSLCCCIQAHAITADPHLEVQV